MIRAANHSSYPRIGDAPWDQQLRRVARDRDRGLAGDDDVRLVEDEVAALVVAEQARAFVDVVTDGLVRWAGPLSHLPRRWDGIESGGLVRWFATGLYDRRPVVTGPIRRREGVLAAEAAAALSVRPTGLKAVLPGPVTLSRLALDRDGRGQDAIARELALALAEEAAEVAAAGVAILQLDEPILCRAPETIELVAETAGAIFARAGAAATTILSTYFGDLAAVASELDGLPGTHLGLDLVEGTGNWPLLAKLPEGRGLHLGLFDARTTRVEPAAEIVARLVPYREVLMARDVMVGPQAGLELVPRDVAFEKLLQARYVRETLQKDWRWRG